MTSGYLSLSELDNLFFLYALRSYYVMALVVRLSVCPSVRPFVHPALENSCLHIKFKPISPR